MSKRRAVRQAVRLFESFREDEPREILRVRVPTPSAAIVVGHVDAIDYTTTHGNETVRYRHKFRSGSRPLLCATSDGKQLLLLGGRFTFTELGIVDIDSRGNPVIPKNHGK